MKKFPMLATLALVAALALAAGCTAGKDYHQAQAKAIQAGEQTRQAVATGLGECAKSTDPATRAQCTLGLADTVGKHAGHNTTISGTASGTQSGVVVPTGTGATGNSTPADSHDSTTTNKGE